MDLGESFQMNICLHNLASIQPRTNPPTFGAKFRKHTLLRSVLPTRPEGLVPMSCRFHAAQKQHSVFCSTETAFPAAKMHTCPNQVGWWTDTFPLPLLPNRRRAERDRDLGAFGVAVFVRSVLLEEKWQNQGQGVPSNPGLPRSVSDVGLQ